MKIKILIPFLKNDKKYDDKINFILNGKIKTSLPNKFKISTGHLKN